MKITITSDEQELLQAIMHGNIKPDGTEYCMRKCNSCKMIDLCDIIRNDYSTIEFILKHSEVIENEKI